MSVVAAKMNPMEIAHTILVVLHMLGLAGIIGGFLANVKAPKVVPAMLHGALTQIVTGIFLVGLAEMGDDDVNHAKIGVKLVVALIVTAAVFIGARADEVSRGALMARVAGVLAIVNVIVAVAW